ncbi:hypothetical protein DFH05DRAFT_1539796 [Lentinula detonsa]|uniref:Uncharacterized protein n=1 Tax=Lentinula detonsa TaxID=2804962 RepID=A0A9W8P7M9_9AGAR|nr:hypothetical protein DFH05DRAFT_1539796 [Lentinula detonsa]
MFYPYDLLQDPSLSYVGEESRALHLGEVIINKLGASAGTKVTLALAARIAFLRQIYVDNRDEKVFVMIHFGNMWTKSSKISRNRSGGRYPSRSRILWKPTSIHTAMSIRRGRLMRTNFHGLFTSIPRPSFIFASCTFSYAPIYFSLMLLY